MKSLKKEMLQHKKVLGNIRFDWYSWGNVDRADVLEVSPFPKCW